MKHILSKKNRALISELVRTDFKLRYQGSVLGYAWSLLRPLLIFLILYIVFVKFLKIGGNIPNYPIYLLFGIVLWQFFADITNQSLVSIVARGDLIRKIRISRWIIIISTSIGALINLAFNMAVLFIFVFVSGMDLLASSLYLPLIFIEIYLFALGVSLILATMFVKYRDVSYVWEVFLQAGFYITPILYPLSLITNASYQKILLMNPMAQSVQDARHVFVTDHALTINSVFGSGSFRLIPLTIVAVFLIVGVNYFKRKAPYFAEDI